MTSEFDQNCRKCLYYQYLTLRFAQFYDFGYDMGIPVESFRQNAKVNYIKSGRGACKIGLNQ